MKTRFLTPLILAGAALFAGRAAAAQDVDPQAALACSQAVDGQDWDQVMSACPAVLAQLPEDHPYYASWTQSVNYAYGLACPGAGEAEQWDQVIATCEPALQANEDAFIFNYFLGRAYAAKQDWTRAAVNFSSFLNGVQGNSEAAAQLSDQVAFAQRVGGIAYARANAVQDAIPLLQAAAAADPKDVEVQFRLGRALLATGEEAGAERALSAYIEEAPNPAPGIVFLAGQLSYNAGDYAKADERLSAFLAAEPNGRGAPEAHYMLALALQGSDEDRAITHYQGFLGGVGPEDPRVPDASFALGTIFFNKDDCSSAEPHYNRFLELAPDHQNAAQVTEILAAIAESGCQGN